MVLVVTFFDQSYLVLQVAQLMMIDCKRAISLFIHHRDIVSPSDVVSQLVAAKTKCDYRQFLHLYLHSLFESNPHAGRDFHDMQVCGKWNYLMGVFIYIIVHAHLKSIVANQ